MKIKLTALALLAASTIAYADSYDPATNQLSIPTITLPDGAVYNNVVITVGKILSFNTGSPGVADSYVPATNILTIPGITVAGATYTNVKVTVGQVIAATPAPAPTQAPTPVPAPFSVTSATYQNNGVIPLAAACAAQGGGNVSPQLSLANLPANTSKLAIVMDDETAPCGTGVQACVHWAAFNIPASKSAIATGENLAAIPNVTYGQTYDGNSSGYAGPCPPVGPAHTYTLTVYALSNGANIAVGTASTNADFASTYKSSILGKASLVGTYSGK